MNMEFLMLFLCVVPAVVVSISVSPNGNSPKVKMSGGMMVDMQKGFVPIMPLLIEASTIRSNYDKSRRINANMTKLALNERYRRLIPYMTFYYANDLATPTTDSSKNVEVEKAQILEAKEIPNQRQPKKLYYSQRNIPRYQGNRLTQYNIASANPTKIYYKDGVPIYQSPKVASNVNPLLLDIRGYNNEPGRIFQKSPSVGFLPITKRPFLNLYNDDLPNIRYYLSEKEHIPKYKLVPYEQTPPVKVSNVQTSPVKLSYEYQDQMPYEPVSPVKISYKQRPVIVSEQVPTKEPYEQSRVQVSVQQPLKTTFEQSSVESYDQNLEKMVSPPIKVIYEQPPVKVVHELSRLKATKESPVQATYYEQNEPPNDDIYEPKKPVVVSVLVPKEIYVKPRPVRPYNYANGNTHQVRKQPSIVSETYYENQRPLAVVSEPVIESGFKPIVTPAEYTTEASVYTSTLSQQVIKSENEAEKQIPYIEPSPATPDLRQNYYQYVVDQPQSSQDTTPKGVTLASLLNSLQVNRAIPKPITEENVASSIKTLLQVLNNLKAAQSSDGVAKPLLSTPTPFVSTKVEVDGARIVEASPEIVDTDLNEPPFLVQVNAPSQHLDDNHSLHNGQRPPSSQQFPLPVTSDEEGGTPGTPGVDYPILNTIPQTKFDCKSQRYKGFFADTETRCQVWHYCDLNGGQASFLCPNGTIFSQAGLTCDWWFNVRCDSTTQLYVLNESLYKYILPHSPKFPEDYSGPLVDKYLTLKFKEMEEEFKKKKSRNEKSDSEEEDDDEEEDEDENYVPKSVETDKRQLSDLSEASVIVETVGTSGKVQRLYDE